MMHARVKDVSADRIRLGHALHGGPGAVAEALEISLGKQTINARPPRDPSAVERTEERLGIDRDGRPVYAYLGDLNPALGAIGLVVERTWADYAQGVTRCDSGGLGGRRGRFSALSSDEADQALHELSYGGATAGRLADWEQHFRDELQTAYPSHRHYVDGDPPTTLPDLRDRLIRGLSDPDRRLWTWEVRLDRGPQPEQLVALSLSPEAGRELDDLVDHDPARLPPIPVIRGSATAIGVHFHHPRVRDFLAGGR
jgi:hypothetical protein